MNKKNAIISGVLVSAIAEVFLVYLVYFNQLRFEPIIPVDTQVWLNALFNGISAIFLFLAVSFIRKNKKKQHVISIHLSLLFSALFLINYIFYHSSVGHVVYGNEDYKILYFGVLITHLIASFISLPLIFVSYLLGLFNHLKAHKQLAYTTFFIWEYVSITGVLIVLIRKFLD